MKRCTLFAVALVAIAGPVQAGDKNARLTIAYLQKLQTAEGGFQPFAMIGTTKVPASLRATTSAVRALNYFGGDLPNKELAMRFVASCYDPKAGGFSDTPGGRPNVITTAIGMMAVVDLNMPLDKFGKAKDYLNDNAKSFEEIRMAAAGFEAIKERSPKQDTWAVEVFKLQNKDGTFGQGPSLARDTGGSAVTLLRLNRIPRAPGIYLQTFRRGRLESGGWGQKDDQVSDLESTYRVMRCYHMMKERPADTDGVRALIARCRNPDGGYSVAPSQASSVSGTYFAAIILYWLDNG